MRKMKNKVFNKRGLTIYMGIFILAILLTALDSDNMIMFITTKIIALILYIPLYKGLKYIPSKYMDE